MVIHANVHIRIHSQNIGTGTYPDGNARTHAGIILAVEPLFPSHANFIGEDFDLITTCIQNQEG